MPDLSPRLKKLLISAVDRVFRRDSRHSFELLVVQRLVMSTPSISAPMAGDNGMNFGFMIASTADRTVVGAIRNLWEKYARTDYAGKSAN